MLAKWLSPYYSVVDVEVKEPSSWCMLHCIHNRASSIYILLTMIYTHVYVDQAIVCILTVDCLNKMIPTVNEVAANCLGQPPSSRSKFNFNRIQTDSGSVSSEVDLQRNCRVQCYNLSMTPHQAEYIPFKKYCMIWIIYQEDRDGTTSTVAGNT